MTETTYWPEVKNSVTNSSYNDGINPETPSKIVLCETYTRHLYNGIWYKMKIRSQITYAMYPEEMPTEEEIIIRCQEILRQDVYINQTFDEFFPEMLDSTFVSGEKAVSIDDIQVDERERLKAVMPQLARLN